MNTNPFEVLNSRLDRIEQIITTYNPSSNLADETLSLTQAAKLCQISVSRMYDLSRKKVIPSSRIGTRYVFIKAELLNWLKNQPK